MPSNAIDSSLISKVVGYDLQKGFFGTTSPNLPQRIVILGEANTNMQDSVEFDKAYEITSSAQAGQIFGFGSPIQHVMNILRPISGSGVAGIPTIVYCQDETDGRFTAAQLEIVAVGTATANVTHTLIINGRRSYNGQTYNFTVNTDDTPDLIHQKIEDAINSVLSAPVSAESTGYEVLATTKWRGLTSDDISIEIDTNGNSAGITYSVDIIQNGAGTPSIQGALDKFGQTWNTVIINTYGLESSIIESLETFNGKPGNPATGRYSSIVWKPFFAFTGYTDIVMTDAITFTDARKTDVTIAMCPTPGSKGWQFEAAANFAALYAPQAQNTPSGDVSGKYLPDMPTPEDIGDMDVYLNRNLFLTKGCSTVQLHQGQYQIMDFVTTYHPEGEFPPQYRYVRALTIDWNVRFAYFLLEQIYVVDKVICKDADIVTETNVIKPIGWKQVLSTNLFPDLERRALITDSPFSIASLQVAISQTNPDRFNTAFDYKRTGFVRQASTTVKAGFNFSN